MTPEAFKSISDSMGSQGSQIMQDHLVTQVFKSVVNNPKNADPNLLLNNVSKVLEKYKNVMSPETQKTFLGAKTLLEEAGYTGQPGRLDKIGNIVKAHPMIVGSMISGAIGGSSGFQEGHDIKSTALGLLLGVGAGVGAVKFSSGLLNSTLGQKLLRHIADHPETAHGLLNTLVQTPAIAEDKLNPQDQQTQGSPQQ